MPWGLHNNLRLSRADEGQHCRYQKYFLHNAPPLFIANHCQTVLFWGPVGATFEVADHVQHSISRTVSDLVNIL
jgi:hypothetical protein